MNPIFFVCLDISGYLLIAWLSFYFQDRVLCFVFLSRELLSSGILNEDLDQNKFISPPRICFVEAWWVRSVIRSPSRWPRGEWEGFFLLPGTGIENHRNCFPGFREGNGNKKCHSDLRERDLEGIAGNENSRSPLLWPRPFQLQILQNASESLRKYCQKVLLKWSGVTKLYSRYFGKWENINNNSPSFSSYMHSEPW